MKLGIFAKTFDGSNPGSVLAAAHAAGYAAVQYNMACSGLDPLPEVIPDGEAETVQAAARAAGVEIAAVSATFNMIHPDQKARRRGFAGLRCVAEAAPAMGARLLTLCTGTFDATDMWRRDPQNGTPAAWRELTAAMEEAVGIAEEFDVELGVEPELANVVSSAALARRLIDEIGSRRIRIVLDAANLFEVATGAEQKRIVASGIELLADRIAIAHAKDRRADGSFTFAGDGVLDYVHYVECLRRVGFDGPFITHGLKAEDARGVAGFLRGILSEEAPR